MRAKTINEIKNFERGQEPKKAMGTGIGDKIDMAKGMKIFVTWTYNLDGNFIEEIWGKDTMITEHLRAKFKGILSRSKEDFMDPNSIIKFIHELSDHYKMDLYNYIVEKYKDRWG